MVQTSPALPVGAGGQSRSAGLRGSEYAALSRQVRQAGLLDRRLRYYTWKMALTGLALTGLALAAGWTMFAVLGDSWWQLGTAVFLAVIFAQIGFIGHDAGHRQVFRSRRANYTTAAMSSVPACRFPTACGSTYRYGFVHALVYCAYWELEDKEAGAWTCDSSCHVCPLLPLE
jgi:hypothetical protein